jgi:hypothetical protein
MPFDAAPDQSIESRIIDEALRILGPNGEHWIKGGDINGKFCMLHALAFPKLGFPEPLEEETELKILEAIAKLHGSYIYIPSFNDSPWRTFEEILAVLQLARTTRPSAALRRVVEEYRRHPQLLYLPQLVSAYDDKVRRQRRKTIASEIGIACGAIVMMLVAVCIPL